MRLGGGGVIEIGRRRGKRRLRLFQRLRLQQDRLAAEAEERDSFLGGPGDSRQADDGVVALAARQLEERSLALYVEGARRAEAVGLILADTKFEFGWIDGEVAVIDEVLTPDSSRFWDASTYEPGSSPQSFDKQFVRDFVSDSAWNKEPPAPALPEDVIRGTRDRYVAAYERLTGRSWGPSD